MARIALTYLPERVRQGSPVQQTGGFTSGLLGIAAVEQQKKLRAALQLIQGEIAYGRKMLIDAKRDHVFWNPNKRGVPIDAWKEHERLVAEAPESLEGYRVAVAAYHEFYRIDQRLHERSSVTVPKPVVLITDHLDEAISIATDAEAKLQAAADSIK